MRTVINGSREIEAHIVNRLEFKTPTRNFRGYPNGKCYLVWSYGTLIGEYWEGVWYVNDTIYSPTTSTHQRILRDAIGEYDWVNNSVHLDHLYRGVQTLWGNVFGKVALKRAERIACTL